MARRWDPAVAEHVAWLLKKELLIWNADLDRSGTLG